MAIPGTWELTKLPLSNESSIKNKHGGRLFCQLNTPACAMFCTQKQTNKITSFLDLKPVDSNLGNIEIMSLKPSPYRIIWAHNKERPNNFRKGRIGSKICPMILYCGVSIREIGTSWTADQQLILCQGRWLSGRISSTVNKEYLKIFYVTLQLSRTEINSWLIN